MTEDVQVDELIVFVMCFGIIAAVVVIGGLLYA